MLSANLFVVIVLAMSPCDVRATYEHCPLNGNKKKTPPTEVKNPK